MAIRLTLLCHARLAGRPGLGFPTDDPIDKTAFPASGLALDRFDRVWAAPELRTRQTAEALAPNALVIDSLRDGDYGSWRGRSLDEIFRNDPRAASVWLSDPEAAPHGGESLAACLHRIGDWLDRHEASGHTVAVTHPAIIRAAVVHCLGAPPQAFWRLDVEPLSAADLRRNAGRWTLRSVGPTGR